MTLFCLFFFYHAMLPVSPAAKKKQKQRQLMTELNKRKNREKDNLARESVWINMSPEEKELQRIKSRLCKEINRKRQRQSDSANVAEMRKQTN